MSRQSGDTPVWVIQVLTLFIAIILCVVFVYGVWPLIVRLNLVWPEEYTQAFTPKQVID